MKHKLPTILTIIVVGLGVLFVIGLRVVDVIAKSVIDGQVTDILGVESRVGGVSLGVLTSDSSFTDITIKNPPGFDYDYILTVDRAEIDSGIGTLLSSDIDIPHMELDGLTFDLEEIDDKVNLEVLIKHVNEYVKSLPPATGDTNLIIRELKVKNVRLRAKGKIVTLAGGKIDQKIPDFTVKNVGTKSGASELTSRFISILTHVIIHQVFNHPIDGLSNVTIGGINTLLNKIPLLKDLPDLPNLNDLKGLGDMILGDKDKDKDKDKSGD